MIGHVADAVLAVEPRRVVAVVTSDDHDVAKELAGVSVDVGFIAPDVGQDPCAAVLATLATWTDDDLELDLDPGDDDVLVVPANVPLLSGDTLRAMHRAHRRSDASATVLSSDADGEMESEVWFVRRSLLAPALRRADSSDIAAIGAVLRATGHGVNVFVAPFPEETWEIRDRADLARVEARLRQRINARWLRRGVTMRDPQRTYIDSSVDLQADVTLYPGVVLEGTTTIGRGTQIGPGCRLVDTRVGARCRLDHTSGELATVGDDSRVGPYVVLEPGSEIPAATVTGPFYTAGPDTN
jgi:bifunctional UDP-N-acetylglucosamine pyrophosphorylase / glucosamine-1-phosphate N-acetyltransferase